MGIKEILKSKRVLGGKYVGKERVEGRIVRLSKRSCEIELNELVALLTNLKMNLGDVDEGVEAKDFYGKVIEQAEERWYIHMVRFTSVPREVSAYFQSHWQYGKISV